MGQDADKTLMGSDLLKIKTVHGGFVHVLKAEYEVEGRKLLKLYNSTGTRVKPTRHGNGLIHRDNLDPEGKRKRVTHGGQSVFGRNGQGYATPAAVKAEITRRGQKFEHFDIRLEKTNKGERWIGLYHGPVDPETGPTSMGTLVSTKATAAVGA